MVMSQERRKAPRAAEPIAVAIVDGGGELHAETKNLSASGAYCVLERFIAPMTKLALRFELPNGARRATIQCSGVVVRSEPIIVHAERGSYYVAIFFTDLAEQDRAMIKRFVQQRLSAPRSSG